MKNLFKLPLFEIGLLLTVSCANSPQPVPVRNNLPQSGSPVSNYSPAMPNGYMPKDVRETAEQLRESFMEANSFAASDVHYRYFYGNDGRGNLEFTVIPKANYKWESETWIACSFSGIYGTIGNNQISYTTTKKQSDEGQYRMEERRKDPVFREIEKVVLQIAIDYDYDFYSAYGMRVKYRSPNTKKAVCEGYAGAVSAAFRNHPLISRVETWASSIGSHAWNILVLKDGRKLYCDATWYDGNKIDDEGYVVDIPQQDPVNLTFDVAEFDSLGGAVNDATGRLLAVHMAWRDAKLKY